MPADNPQDDLLTVEVRTGATTTIVLTGDLDPATAPRLQAAIDDHADGAQAIVLDLAGVSFLDSSGLRVLVAANEALRGRGIALTLRSPSDNVRRLLDLTGLGEIIAVE